MIKPIEIKIKERHINHIMKSFQIITINIIKFKEFLKIKIININKKINSKINLKNQNM